MSLDGFRRAHSANDSACARALTWGHIRQTITTTLQDSERFEGVYQGVGGARASEGSRWQVSNGAGFIGGERGLGGS